MKDLTKEEMGITFQIDQPDELGKAEKPMEGKTTPLEIPPAPKPTFMKAHPWTPKGRK